MTNPARITDLGQDNLIYARYIKPVSPKGATSRQFWKVKERSFPVENLKHLEAKKGDYIEISVKTGVTIGAAFLVFMVPLILFITLYGVGGLFFSAEGPRVILGSAGLGLGLILPAFINLFKKEKNYPQLERILSPEDLRELIDCGSACESCGGCG